MRYQAERTFWARERTLSKYKGVIIEESLDDSKVLKSIKITHTRVEKVTESHATPHLAQWTLHSVEVDANKIGETTKLVSRILQPTWYVHFYDDKEFFVVFKDKVISFLKDDSKGRQSAIDYGLTLGIPEYQLDFCDNNA